MTPENLPSGSICDAWLAAMPVFGICGLRGAGKTTLVERLVPELRAEGLAVLAVKHGAHGLRVDHPGKDSDRFFRAGADVLAEGPQEQFLHTHRHEADTLTSLLLSLCPRYDVVLVEGHRGTPVPKIWLLGEGEAGPPEASGILAVLRRDADRAAVAANLIRARLREQWSATPLFGGVLIGGQSTRMGHPKHLIEDRGRTWLQHAVEQLSPLCSRVIVLGAGEIPQGLTRDAHLPDAPGIEGPMAGVLAAMRWAPAADWLVTACDLPDMTGEALAWLLSHRRPGVWVVMPRLEAEAPVEPLPAYYGFRCRAALELLASEGSRRLRDLAVHPKSLSPVMPENLRGALRNANCPTDVPDGNPPRDPQP